ncbi:MAG: 60S ribosomal protein L13 [Bathelium mastoideum]|nr:MAG: 60S ribosomal protein L13 [Bathelium mastoideum]KAI9686838.1 MAG: 60S ribosomal protein L13 [Bathelium mastoideum]
MTIKHNQQIQHNHFRKDWQRRVRVHFDQPGKKKSRRDARAVRAAKLAPRPVDRLRPIVHCPTIKYNRRVRAGRGFSLAELKEAGIPRKLASTIGIAVDPRRQNLSEESLAANVERLRNYRERLILFPRRTGKTKEGDAPANEVAEAKARRGLVGQLMGTQTRRKGLFGVENHVEVKEGKTADYEGEENAYRRLRDARSEAKFVGVREKRAKAKAEEAAAQKK